MMMQDDPKRLAVMIVAKQKKASSSYNDAKQANESLEVAPKKEGAEEDADPGLSAASEEMLQAIEAKDANALKAALKDFLSMCEEAEGDDTGDQESM